MARGNTPGIYMVVTNADTTKDITRPEDIIPKTVPIILFPHSHFFYPLFYQISDYSQYFTYYSLQVSQT